MSILTCTFTCILLLYNLNICKEKAYVPQADLHSTGTQYQCSGIEHLTLTCESRVGRSRCFTAFCLWRARNITDSGQIEHMQMHLI